MLKNISVLLLTASFALSGYAYAGFQWITLPCPEAAQIQMDADFGGGTSSKTSCLQVRNNIKNVISWNSATTNKRSGFAQQAHVTRNMIQNYENMYAMKANTNYTLNIVAYGAGGRWLLNDEAYNRIFNVTTGNPSAAVIAMLLERNITVELCQNTMRGNGWVSSDLISGVAMVPGGVVAVADLQHRGYVSIIP